MLLRNLVVYLRDKDVSAAELGLWIILSEYRNGETGLCCPSQDELSQRSQLSPPTVRKYLRKGQDLGLYSIKDNPTPDLRRHFHSYAWAQNLLSESKGRTSLFGGKNDSSPGGKKETLKPLGSITPLTVCVEREGLGEKRDPSGSGGKNETAPAGEGDEVLWSGARSQRQRRPVSAAPRSRSFSGSSSRR